MIFFRHWFYFRFLFVFFFSVVVVVDTSTLVKSIFTKMQGCVVFVVQSLDALLCN